MTNDEMAKPARLAVGQLIQHYDYVQIFVGKYSESMGSQYAASGEGLQYAREGHARAWLDMNQENNREKMRPQSPQDGSEGWKS